jgi:hypothetical protein
MPPSLPPSVEPLEGRTLLVADLAVDRSRLIFTDVQGGAAAPAQTVVVRNAGDRALTVTGASVSGTDAARFGLTRPALPATLAPGASVRLAVAFNAGAPGPQGAALRITSNDPDRPTTDVTLRGLGVRGQFGDNEPSLQWILDTFQIPVRTGDTNPASSVLDFPPAAPNDEVTAQLLVKAGPGPVTVEPIGVFSNAADPGMRVGFYKYPGSGSSITRTELFTTPSADVQTLQPRVTGNTAFEPGADVFGLYSQWPAFAGRITTSEDFRNTWETSAARRREMRWYPLKNPNGSVVPNAYVMGNEEAANHDMQDGVFIVRNVKPLTSVAAPTGLRVSGLTSGSISLAWADASTVETAYKVERSADGGAFTPVATLGRNTTKYTNSGLSASTRYAYRVRAVAGSITSGASSAVTATTTPVSPGGQLIEAESATRNGPVVATGQPGFTGAGYADFVGATGEFLEWTVHSATARAVTLEFRYANGTTADRPLELRVNGSVLNSRVSFVGTGAWTTWRTASVTVTLQSGPNKVRLTSIGSSGANIDSLTVRG